MANQRGESTSIGHFWNRCIDAVNNLFETYSFWTHASDVEFDDGGIAQDKVGAINGITSDYACEDESMAASITSVSALNNSLTASDGTPFRFGVTKDGQFGYITTDGAGADTVNPFKNGSSNVIFVACFKNSSNSTSYTKVNGTIFTIDNNDYCTLNSDFTITFNKACNVNINLIVRAEWDNVSNYIKRGNGSKVLLNGTSIVSGSGGGSNTSATLPATLYSINTQIASGDILTIQTAAIKGAYYNEGDVSSYYVYLKAYPIVIIELVE